jgi:CBS domain-containing protein/mannitol/fructose-specific phosphotransferase system IIA component (Ntr-type)
MKLLDLLRPEHVLVPVAAPNLRGAIDQLVTRLEETGAIQPSDALHRRVRAEPLRDMIAVSDDVALPHYRSENVPGLAVALGIAPHPIRAEDPGLDLQPRIIGLVLAPQDAPVFYLQTTSTLARLLRQPGVVDAMMRQTTPEAVLALPQFQDVPIRPSLSVRDIMVHRVHSVPPDASLRSTMALMLRRRLRAVPVVGPKGEVLGMVTDSDLMRTLLPQIPRAASEDITGDTPVLDRPVRDCMTRSVLCVSEELGVGEVASMMIHKDVEQVPVVQAGVITGMVSRGDIIRKLFSRQ